MEHLKEQYRAGKNLTNNRYARIDGLISEEEYEEGSELFRPKPGSLTGILAYGFGMCGNIRVGELLQFFNTKSQYYKFDYERKKWTEELSEKL